MSIMMSDRMIDWLKRAGVVPETTKRVEITLMTGDVARIKSWGYVDDKAIATVPPPELIEAEMVHQETGSFSVRGTGPGSSCSP